jgi:PAS domain S-box-containing protein
MKYIKLPTNIALVQRGILLGSLLLLLWSMLLFDLHGLHQQISTNSRIQIENLVRAFAEEVKSSVSTVDIALIDLRDAWLTNQNNFAAAVQRRQAYFPKDVGFQVAIINANGVLTFSSTDPRSKPMDLSDREHFQVHRDQSTDRLFISKPIIGRVSQRWTVQFTRPLIDANDRFAGVIVLSVAPQYFSRFYESIHLGEGSSIGLVRRSGELLARSPHPEKALGRSINGAPFLQGRSAESGLFEKTSEIDGTKRIYGWRTLPNVDLVVSIGQSLDTIFEPYHHQRQIHIAVGIGISFLLALISYFSLAGMRQRTKATAALVESEARWKLALEAAGEAVWDWDIKNNTVHVSGQWKEILGLTNIDKENWVHECLERIHPDDVQEFEDKLSKHLDRSCPTYLSEHRMRCGDGTWKWVLERGMAVSRAANGDALRMVGTMSDVTLRKQSEEALKTSMEQLSAEQLRIKIILENSYDAFVAVDQNGHITDWNNKAELTFGWRSTEVIGKDLAEVIVPEEKREAHNAGFRRYTATGKSTVINTVLEVEAVHRTGRRFPVELAVAGFFDGRNYAANAFVRDVTERKEAERLAIERTKSLEEARKALQQSQKLEALGKLTAGIAHDFNNVLQTLTTGLQLALLIGKESKAKASLEACQRAVQRGVDLTRQLLVFGRAQEAHLKTIALGEQINDMVPFLQGALPSNINFKLDLDDVLWSVEIDPLQFELALLNLTMNARDAMPNGGSFSIKAANLMVTSRVGELEPGSYVHIVVSDTGEGMTPELMAKALDPFFTTKAVGKGSGMGLPQAYGFAKQMGGTLLLESQNGKGMRASMYLPRSTKEVPLLSDKPDFNERRNTDGGIVLYVEDDTLVSQTVQPALEAAGFEVAFASNGEEALMTLESGLAIDVVFSDIVMPGTISGIDLSEIVSKRFPQISVILATGYSERRVASSDVKVLAKPYDIGALISAINAAVQGKTVQKNLNIVDTEQMAAVKNQNQT